MVIKRIGPFSAGKIYGAISGATGLIAGAIFTLFALAGAAIGVASGDDTGASLVGLLFGVGAIVILPILYFVVGFVGGAFMALVYNIAAGLFGGVELEVE